MIRKVIYIKADTNDADYVSDETDLSSYTEKQIETLRSVAKIVMGTKGYNWDNMDYSRGYENTYKGIISEDDLELFNECVPFHEYGVHTIEAVEIRNIEVLESF